MATALRGTAKWAVLMLAALLVPTAAIAQAVEAPTLDGAALRARLGPAMAPPGRPLPADAAELDAMVARGQFAQLAERLREVREPHAVLLDLNWQQVRLFDGAGFFVALGYLDNLWRMGASLPGAAGENLKQSAGMMFVYALALARLDAVRCGDASAPGHRQDQLVARSGPVIAYIGALPRERRMALGTIALAVEGATAAVRRDDPVLCGGGLEEIVAGLRAQGDRPLPRAPAALGRPGTTYLVPPAPGHAPAFVAPAVWKPKQAALRATMPTVLTAFLSSDTPAADR